MKTLRHLIRIFVIVGILLTFVVGCGSNQAEIKHHQQTVDNFLRTYDHARTFFQKLPVEKQHKLEFMLDSLFALVHSSCLRELAWIEVEDPQSYVESLEQEYRRMKKALKVNGEEAQNGWD